MVSHACAVATNRAVYAALAERGERVELVVPTRWRDAYVPAGYDTPLDGDLSGHVHPSRVAGQGRPQRHVYLARCAATLRRLRARVVVVEEEPFSVAALQWSLAARRARVAYGVQVAETLERRLPAPVARWRTSVLAHAAFVLARSPGAAELARRWGARGVVEVVPHDVTAHEPRTEPDGPFTVAYLGRLVDEKGVVDLLAAVTGLEGVRLLVAGAGPLEAVVRGAGASVEYAGALGHDLVDGVYARAHVTCVPSRVVTGWEEQFGRVVVESLVRAVPVVATSTGALPWVLATTGGGVLVAERDPAALGVALAALRDDRAATRALGATGRDGALGTFSTRAVATVLEGLLARVSPRAVP